MENAIAISGMENVLAITMLVYIIGLIVRATKLDNKWIPTICGVSGILLGLLALYIGVPEFPATDYMTAAAVGGASGLAATGMDQVFKQMRK